MARQSFLWTSLPHGASGDALRLAVALTPRLDEIPSDTALNEFPLWVDWPRQVMDALPNLTFDVRVRTAAGQLVSQLGTFAPDPALAQQLWSEGWQALFSAVTVQPFAMRSIAEREVHSYPASELNSELKGRYNRAAAASLARDDPTRNVAVLEPPAEELPTPALRDYLAYHERALTPRLVDDIRRRNERQDNRPEFHETLTWIGNYPELLPRLGLVFELRIPRATLPAASGLLQVQASPLLGGVAWPPRCQPGEPCPAESEHHSPFTVVDAETFWPRASDIDDSTTGSLACGGLARGLLCPRGDEAGRGLITVSQIDFEGAALRLGTMGIGSENGTATNGSSLERALPALRNAGFSLLRARQHDLAKAQARQAEENDAQLTNGEEPILWAQHLNRGYRLDVFETRTFQWRSLHERNLDYGLAGQPARERITGEGFVQLSATVAAGEGNGHDGSDDLLMLETLARWSGWSLTVPRPASLADPNLTAPAIPPPNPFGLTLTQSMVDRPLPRLRYGDTFAFRIRHVDLVGNSPSLAEASQQMPSVFFVPPPSWAAVIGSDREHRYLRYEPIAPPVIVPRAAGAIGGRGHTPRASLDHVDDLDEVVDRLVLRSNGHDASAQAYVERFPQWKFANELHLVPPRTSPAIAEAHGKLDEALQRGGEEAIDAIFALIQQDGDLPEHEPDPTVMLPYLPDPLARGVTVRVLGNQEPLAGGAGEPLTFCRYRAEPDWPHLLPFRLELGEAPSYQRPTYDSTARLLTAKLPPGAQAKITLSSFFRRRNDGLIPEDLKGLGLWAWFAEVIQALHDGVEFDGIKPGTPLGEAVQDMAGEGAEGRAGEGRFWFLTPPQVLLLVHAVQQPLDPPRIAELEPVRAPGDTFVSLLNRIETHPESTARLALTAAWEEIIDAPPALPRWLPADDSREEQRVLPVQASVREQQILEPHDQGEHPYLWKEDEPNPWWPRKGRISLCVGGALERPVEEEPVAIDMRGARLPGVTSLPPLRHEFGDTKHRFVTYSVIGTSRFQNDFPPPDGVDRETWTTRRSAPCTINVLSSARPAPPTLRGVMPAFLRRTQRQGSTFIRQKFGGVRVYLDRPWFTTGAEEALAVVLWGGAQWPLPAGHRAAPFSTRWGRDPIWKPVHAGDALLVPSQPAPMHFPLRVQSVAAAETFTVPNAPFPDKTFHVAAHSVRFNAERNLWFADIQIDLGDAYFPFVQLALGRFQPHSVDSLHLSEVTLVDPLQITPARRVECTLAAGTPQHAQLRVTGTSQATTEGPAGMTLPGNQVRVQVERRARGADDLGWSPATLPEPISIDPPSLATDLLWSGRIPLPDVTADEDVRILILEDDFLAADGDQAGQFVATPRLAYAESITLDELLNP
jgi:hypothetical protein